MNKLCPYIHKICEPTTAPDELEKKLRYRRNVNFLIMQIIFLGLLILYIALTKKCTSWSDIWFLSVYIIILVVFCLTCRAHCAFFVGFYSFITAIAGPVGIHIDNQGVIFAWTNVFLAPLFLLHYSGCRSLYIRQVIIQLFHVNYFYKCNMTHLIEFSRPDEFMQKMASAASFAVIVSTFMVNHIGGSLQKTYKQEIELGEHKRKELEVQKTFILSFSHEIRNLINNLTGNIQLSLIEEIPHKVKGFLHDAEIGSGMLIQLINNILDTGNLEVGELEVNPSSQVIHNTLEKMWRMCAYLLKAKNLKGQLRISKDLPRNIKVDHERLLQILINLVVNAVKFTDKGSIDVKIEWVSNSSQVTENSFFPSPFDDENEGVFEKDRAFSILNDDFNIIGLDNKRWRFDKHSNISGEPGPGLVKISVTDTGCGVHADNIPKIFDKFSGQIFGEDSSNRLGTTIGLYITKVLCSMMGGDIKVFSKPNQGTSFIACIPGERVVPRMLQEMSTGTFSNLPEIRKLKAMIVDDLDFNIIVLSNYMDRMKIDVEKTAVNGQDAYEKYVQSVEEGNRPDIITMDVEMPVMDGKAAAKKIREYEKLHGLEPCFLIMISGNVGESEIKQCLWDNESVLANQFLKKPAIYDDVSRVINDRFYIGSQSDLSTSASM